LQAKTNQITTNTGNSLLEIQKKAAKKALKIHDFPLSGMIALQKTGQHRPELITDTAYFLSP
jgi:hypothetical protein